MWRNLPVDFWISIAAIAISLSGSYWIVRRDWKRFGLFYVLISVVGNIICYTFSSLGFYSFPFRLFSDFSIMPFTVVTTFFPFYVLAGFVYSPRRWPYKIPFYWAIIHAAMLIETVLLMKTNLIRYEWAWDMWDSYTWWWLFVFFFEWVGSRIVPQELRRPLPIRALHYGRLGWLAIHFVLVLTIFLAGVYVGQFMVK